MEESVRAHLLLSIILFAFTAIASADQVTMTNGDHLSGAIIKLDDTSLVLKTDYAGEVKLDWSAVQGIQSTQPLHIILKNGQSFSGPVTASDGHLQVATSSGSPAEAAKADIASLRGESEQAAYEKTLHPGLLQEWSGGSSVSFALTRGNSQTKNLALAFTATRQTLNDKLGLYNNSVYASNDAPGAVPSTTANAIQAGARYDHDITKLLFAFVTADFQTDALQGLNLRSVPGAGLGVHVIKNNATTLDLLAGINYTRENYTTFTRNFAAASFGEELTHKLYSSTVITQSFDFFPDLSDWGEYRGTFNFGTVTKISKWLGWQNAFGDIYVTNPPLGKKQNDLLLTTGLNFSFGTGSGH
jgi:putative salt-induced outer membrane protein YdiY